MKTTNYLFTFTFKKPASSLILFKVNIKIQNLEKVIYIRVSSPKHKEEQDEAWNIFVALSVAFALSKQVTALLISI